MKLGPSWSIHGKGITFECNAVVHGAIQAWQAASFVVLLGLFRSPHETRTLEELLEHPWRHLRMAGSDVELIDSTQLTALQARHSHGMYRFDTALDCTGSERDLLYPGTAWNDQVDIFGGFRRASTRSSDPIYLIQPLHHSSPAYNSVLLGLGPTHANVTSVNHFALHCCG